MFENRKNISSGGVFESVFDYSKAVQMGNRLEQAQMQLSDAVRTVVYVRDMNDANQVAQAHKEVFDRIRPASMIAQVDSMLRTWQRVEIEAYAISL